VLPIEPTVAALNAFEPTGVEDDDVARLDEIVDKLMAPDGIRAANAA
jgi:hypothetical protein